nr:uncharacterized protein LOC108125314 [Drosophila bipectinata]
MSGLTRSEHALIPDEAFQIKPCNLTDADMELGAGDACSLLIPERLTALDSYSFPEVYLRCSSTAAARKSLDSVSLVSQPPLWPEEPKEEPEMPPNPQKRPMVSSRYLEFREKLRRHSGPDLVPEVPPNPAHEMEPLQPWPNSVNPHTGEVGGPAGPEPTRYGDWERKGRVTDF